MKYIIYLLIVAFVVSGSVPAFAQIDARAVLDSAGQARIASPVISTTVNSEVVLSANGLDIDLGSVESHEWIQVEGPFTFESREGAEVTVVPPEPGTYIFELHVTSADGTERIAKKVTINAASRSGDGPADSSMSGSARGEMSTGDDASRGDDDGARMDGRAEADADMDVSTPSLNLRLNNEAGFNIRYHANEQADRSDALDDDDDGDGVSTDTEGEARGQVIAELRVNAEEVRGWDPEKKRHVLERVQANSEVTTANDFGLYIASLAIENEGLKSIDVSEERAELRYRTEVKLFGFIPMHVTAKAQLRSDGSVDVDYPWYAALSRKTGDDAEVFASLATDIRARHDAHMNSVRNMK